MNWVFFDSKGRLRSGWRVVAFFAAYLLLSLVFVVGTLAWFGPEPGSAMKAAYLPIILAFTFSTMIALLLGWLFGRAFERLPFSALGCVPQGYWLRNFAMGSLIGLLTLAGAVLIAVTGGGLTLSRNVEVESSAIATSLLWNLGFLAVAAASEESLFRGYILQTLVRGKLAFFGMAMTASLFALAHQNNPANNKLSFANTLLAGIWFAAAYLKSRDLWLPFGMHLAWNFFQGPVFGISVSGLSDLGTNSLLKSTDAGPDWFTGGAYGIEGGVACSAALAVGLAFLWLLKPLHNVSEPPA